MKGRKSVEHCEPQPAAQWNPQATASFWINRASKLLMQRQDERIRPLGLRVNQIPVLFALEHDGPISQKELAQRAKVEQPTMAEMLARLERDGVIERQPNPQDKRGSLNALTLRSRLQIPAAKASLVQMEEDMMAGFSDAEKALLLNLLQRVMKNLETNV
jgi:MarR family transcriptional regulator, transcriptional regulator for hemolysin